MSQSSQVSSSRSGFLSLVLIRDILIVAFLVIICWKFLNAELKIDLATFSFTDFLALVLALFSVALSVAFYFKANEASNQFYDNTYRFSKDMSEILGRIEAGFGERLRHLDEGYSGVRDKLDKLPPYSVATASDVEKEKEEIRQKEAEQKALIEELARKAKLAEGEKEALFANLAQKSDELEQARIELRQMQESRRTTHEIGRPSRNELIRYIALKMRKNFGLEELNKSITTARIRKLFDEIKPDLPAAALRDMSRLDMLDDDGQVNRDVLMRIGAEIRSYARSQEL